MAGVTAEAEEGAMSESMQKLLPTLPSAVVVDLLSIGVSHRAQFRMLRRVFCFMNDGF